MPKQKTVIMDFGTGSRLFVGLNTSKAVQFVIDAAGIKWNLANPIHRIRAKFEFLGLDPSSKNIRRKWTALTPSKRKRANAWLKKARQRRRPPESWIGSGRIAMRATYQKADGNWSTRHLGPGSDFESVDGVPSFAAAEFLAYMGAKSNFWPVIAELWHVAGKSPKPEDFPDGKPASDFTMKSGDAVTSEHL